MSPELTVSSSRKAVQPLCVSQLLAERAERTPDALALLAPGRAPLPYSRLRRQVDNVVQTLQAMGVGRSDRVALVLPNGPEMALASLAVAASATCAPLNPAYGPREFDFYLANLHVKVLIVQADIDSPVRAVARAQGISLIELSPTLEVEAGCFTLAGETQERIILPGFAQPDDVAVVLHTSGTTSPSKLVPLTHVNICTRAHHICMAHAMVQEDCCLNVMPLFHGHGFINTLLASLMAGASMVCPSIFSAPEFFAWLAEFRPTWYSASPTIHQAILAQAALGPEVREPCSLRFIRSGTAPLPPQVLVELEEVFNVPVIEIYGLTETSMITCNPLPSRARKAGSVGGAMAMDVAIMDDQDHMLPVGAIGEIVVRGTTVMQGYEDNPAANSSAFTHGWFRSGDAGYLDADGYLFLTGRIKESINRGGEKIMPQEVDDVLLSHPTVAHAATFAVPHARLGEDVAAAVVLYPDAAMTADDLRQFAATCLAAFKVPSQVLIVDEIPKDPISGKLLRFGLAEKLGLTTEKRNQSVISTSSAAPHMPVEKILADLWSQVLGLDSVGIHDTFFALGGDSILVMQLLSLVRDVMHVEVSFRSFFEAPTVVGMARSIEIASQTTLRLQVLPLHPGPKDGPLPLSYAQQRLWFLEQVEPSRTLYNLPLAWHCTGDLNVPALERSLGEMVRRHAILRTSFPSVDGQPMQVIAPTLEFPLPVVDLQTIPANEREMAVQRMAREAAQRPFDLAHGPLVHATVLRVSGKDHVLLLTLHHMIFDGWSVEIFWRELATLYTAICNGQPILLPALLLQYADFAVWQRQWLQGEALEAQIAYWKQRLDDALPVLELPTDRPRPPVQTFRGAQQALLLSVSLAAELKALGQQAGSTLFMTLVAAFQILLYRYTGQTDLIIGTPIAGRTRIETEGLIGFFINMLVLRTDLRGNPRFRDLLKRVREVTLEAYDHQDLPFEQLVEALRPRRDLSHHPFIQVVVALQQSPLQARELPRLTVYPVAVDCGTAKFDLTLFLHDTEQGLLTTMEYNTDLFDRGTITRMLAHFQTLLESIIADPEQRLAALPLLTTAERQRLLRQGHSTIADYPQDACLHTLFEAQAERTPDAVAVVCDTQQLTYSVLNRRANQLASHLRILGVGPEVCVGLCVESSLEMVVGLLGILKAGGAYVPLAPTHPMERLATTMTDARVAVLVTQQECLAVLPEHGVSVVCLDTDWAHIAQQSEGNPVSGVMPENLAYVMYTSGSTGTPKGVMVEHLQALAFLHGFEHIAPGGESEIGTTICPYSFDVAVWECFSMLCFGGTLHVVLPDIAMAPEQFVRYLVAQRITSAYIPPALLVDVARYLEQHQAQVALKRLLVGVEPIQQGTLQRLRNLSEPMRIINGYGPTETTVCATLFPFHTATESDRRTPIGTRIRGYEVYLVDTNMQPVPLGIPGELFIGGIGLVRGYINHPELTAEHFMPHPFSPVPGARLYKTGDLARYLPDGNLEFIGRRDQQVKFHGYRIELEEIAAVLRRHPAVREAMVLAQEDTRLGDKRLVAYLVVKQEPAPAPQTLRTCLQQTLPTYMIPSAFVVLEALPRTSHGKLDRQALPIPDTLSSPSPTAFVAPRTPVESALASIWADVLGLERVGIHDNFFELGGDSIRGFQVVARANRVGLRCTLKHLFQQQTIAELAAVAGALPAMPAEQGLVTGSVPLSPIQSWFFEQELHDWQHWNQAMVIEVRQAPDYSMLERAVQHLLVHHDMLRARFRRASDGWQQHIAPPEASALCTRIDLSALSVAQQDAAIVEAATQLQASLNLEHGSLVRVALFERGPHRSARLLLIIHHLVVDSVSWWILLEDLQLAYKQLSAGHGIQLPSKTASFKHWAEGLTAYANSAELRQELPYWLAEPRTQVRCLPVDYPGGANTVASACTVSVSLSTPETDALLQAVLPAYQTHIHDVLLTAMAQALSSWTGARDLLIDLEGHGREEIGEGVDLSRTVGWCTTICPVFLRIEPASTPAEVLKSIKEQLRYIPRQGIGYGVLRYLSPGTAAHERLRALPQAEVCFNYLGRVDQMISGPMFLGSVPAMSGPPRSLLGRRCYLLDVNGRLADGQLQFDWTYSEQIHRRDTIERVTQGFIKVLRRLIVHCQSPNVGGYTPSDFPYMMLSQQALDELMAALGESEERAQH